MPIYVRRNRDEQRNRNRLTFMYEFFLPSYQQVDIIPLGDPLRDTNNESADFQPG